MCFPTFLTSKSLALAFAFCSALIEIPRRAPILYVKGRTYPVDVYHATENHEEDRVDAALKQCFQLHFNKPHGDILVFMPGMSLHVGEPIRL